MIDNSTGTLPRLRDDITISRGAADRNNVANWVIYDPLQHRYFQINSDTKDLIEILQSGVTTKVLIDQARQRFNIAIDQAQVENLLGFLIDNQLLAQVTNDWRTHSQISKQRSPNLFSKLQRSFLFIKIPLVQPQSVLQAMLPFVSWIFTPAFFIITGLSGLTGIYFLLGQWSKFTYGIQSLIGIDGLLYLGLSLIFVKSLHELAHALTATRYGCQVPTMGVAFFLFTPLLYSDVSDAWRMKIRNHRLWISAAGIIAELAIACFATLLWVFLPDGTFRNMVLMLATVSWLMSLLVNLNPLIKFDGYYLLSDILGIDNLQQRSFAFGKWKLREVLFAPGLDSPEKLSRNMGVTLTVFAWLTWVYRLVLFTTIAVLIYQYTFKLLGIFLMVLEIWLLILRPVLGEISHWMKMERGSFSPRRIKIVSGILCFLIGLFVVPWSTQIRIPAKLEAAELSTIYPVQSGKIVSVTAQRGEFVEQGTPLVTLQNFKIENQLKLTRIELKLLRLQLANAVAGNLDRDDVLVLKHQIRAKLSQLAGLENEKQELTILAPISGIIRELNRNIHEGRWINKSEHIALIASENSHKLQGYIPQNELGRIDQSTTGRFIPDDLTRASFKVKLSSVAKSSAPIIEIAALASLYGGDVAVELNDHKEPVPLDAQYLVKAEPDRPIHATSQVMLGIIELNGEARSFAARAWNQIGKVLIREVGF